ncbi:MAG: zinc-ribbon and FHA domain-containing protein [Propionibacteriaceae bacterium]|jgi:pSer/pThr/pTyr-binding forkhead associated (FHA) protein|nr:zinc-ribbon and FHA domain-containing protein [Propionibacteriaceae bacterium]
MRCPACGRDVNDPVNYCPYCGARLLLAQESTSVMPLVDEPTLADDLTPDDIRAIEALPGGSAILIVVRGPGQGARYLLKEDQVIAGRHPDNEVFLDDVTVSRHHAIFARAFGQWTVSDAASLNGTYVNRALISAPVQLRTGDEVQIGKFRLMFFTGPVGTR